MLRLIRLGLIKGSNTVWHPELMTPAEVDQILLLYPQENWITAVHHIA